jgi:hypothetical protein
MLDIRWIGLGIFVLLIAASEVGYRLGHRKSAETDDPIRSQLTTVEAAVLGLLALLLGFSFSMSQNRYENSKGLVREEANAIGTTYLRTSMLPEQQGKRIADMLREYVDVRIASYQALDNSPELAAVYGRTDKLHAQIWEEARAVAAMDPHSIITGLFVQSLNEMIDLEGTQRSAIVNRIPTSVFLLIVFVALLAMGIVGYVAGISAKRHMRVVALVAILLATTMTVIGDLHRPRHGMIRVSTSAFDDVKHMMESPAN